MISNLSVLRSDRWKLAMVLIGLLLALPLGVAAQVPVLYQLVSGWPSEGTQAPYYRRAEVAGVATDAAGRVYLCHPTRLPVLVFDRQGRFLKGWGGGGQLLEPHTVRIDPQGNVWITDLRLHQVKKFSPDGRVLAEYGVRARRGWDSTRFNGPTDVAFGPNGDIYVSDGYGNSRVVRLSYDGKYLGEWGKHGTGPGQFRLPHSLAIDVQGRVFVADRENRRIQVFSDSGTYLYEWRTRDKPYGLYITPDQRLYVSNGAFCTIAIYDLNGVELAYWGKKTTGRLPGILAQPHMLCVDDEGALYTAELRGHRVQKFTPSRRP